MATFRNPFGEAREVPSLGLRIGDGETFEVPDEFAAAFEAQGYTPSKAKTPDQTVSPELAATLTGPVPVSAETPAPSTTN